MLWSSTLSNPKWNTTEICIQRDPEGTVNTAFLGNYQQKTDTDGNTYYEKDQELCDTTQKYIYLRDDIWRVGYNLDSKRSNLYCPETVATPDLCTAGTWVNGNDQDTLLTVTAEACPGNCSFSFFLC